VNLSVNLNNYECESETDAHLKKKRKVAEGDQPEKQTRGDEHLSVPPAKEVSSPENNIKHDSRDVEKGNSDNNQTRMQTDERQGRKTESGDTKDLKPAEQQPVRALVSSLSALNSDMLVKSVLLASKVVAAHLDSCATHCFLSWKASERLKRQGFTPAESHVQYRVEQGNPLCVTSTVHILPLVMANQYGGYVAWKAVLFVVADCGADIIIGYPVLRLGGIVDYNPPEGYGASLRTLAGQSPKVEELRNTAQEILRKGNTYEYEPPTELYGKSVSFLQSSCLDPLEVPPSSGTTVLKTQLEKSPKPGNQSKLPLVKALTESEPYGKNPPLPEEVMEALTLLKNLATDGTPPYTTEQLEEVRLKLKNKRPEWEKCLTQQHLEQVSDKDTEQFINDMMDEPRWQKSIFQTAMHLNTTCDFKEFEIPQKPGKDMWNPPQPKLYRNPTAARITEDWLNTLLENNKCRESTATHPAPVTIVERPPRDPRVCINYINRNHRSEIPVYPMPDVWDFLDETAGFEHYCSFDMAKMFTQFRIKEAHKHLAAFITPRGVFEPNVVMFGLAGAPQHAVREVGGGMTKDPRTNGTKFTEWAHDQNLKGVSPPYDICPITKIVKGSKLRPFIDDVFIRSNHKEGMIKMVELFFEFCESHNLILSRKKATIMRKRLRTLGFVVSKEGKHLDPSRIISLLEMPIPRSKETLHSMLSSFTFVRMFIPNFALIAAPLYEATRGIIWKGPHSGKAQGIKIVDPDFVWTEEMRRAYDQLRNALLESPILVTPDWSLPLFLSVDASMRGEGWVLWQLITTYDGAKVAAAILYGSKKYSDTERKWETTRQEATAIRSALQDVEEYVFGRHFYLFSDHLNLRFMHNSVNRAVLRMRDFLAQFNMTVVHCPGAWNNADSISRLEIDQLPIEIVEDMNSATEGKILDDTTTFSKGTDTSLDFPHQEDKIINITTSKNVAEKEREVITSALRTGIPNHTCPCQNFCGLCSVDIDFDEDLEEKEMIPTSLKTNALKYNTSALEEEGLEPILQQIFHSIGSDLNLKERTKELETNHEHPPPYPSEVDFTIPEDVEDQEDLLWCGPIDRKNVNVKVCKSVADYDTLPSFRFNDRPDSLKENNQENLETADNGSQTTPADFRIATIRFPMIEDFKAIHNDRSGHHGLEYSYRKLFKRCGSKWANEKGEATKLKEQLRQFIEGCPTCQKLRGLREKIKCKHSFIVSRPFLETSYDFIVFKRPDRNGNRYLLVAIDNFSKLVEMKPVQNRDAETVARFLLEIASRYGNCARLRSDREAAFIGQVVTRLNENRGTETTLCIPYRPEANSICERQNAIIMFHLQALVLGCNLGLKDKVAWSDLIPEVFSIVNNTPKNPLGISPLSLVYGVFANYDRPLLSPIAANTQGTTSNPVDYVDALIEWQTRLLEITEEIQSQHFQKLEKRFNSNDNTRTFNEGDFVLQQKDATGISGKPSCKWIGPFLVMKRRDNDPSHPVLDLMNLTDMKVKEAAAGDCRIFNTSWFEEDTIIPELTKIAAADLDEYVVEKILDHRPSGDIRTQPLSKYLFLVKWEGFEEPTWEPYSGVSKLEPLDTYGDLHPRLKIPKLSST